MLWKSEYVEQCQVTADKNEAQGIPITFDQLAGEGQYGNTEDQLQFNAAVYAQANAAAFRAWRKLPSTGRWTEELFKVRHGPDKPFQDFLSRLLQAAGRLMGEGESGLILVKQLAFENANFACQAAIQAF